MTSTIARLGFISISLLTISLSLWKSSELNHAVYLNMENYVGGSSTLHFTFSMLIGFLAVFTFPRFTHATKMDAFGIRLLFCLLLIISAEEFSQLFIESRSFSFDDLSTNWIGMILGYFGAKAITLFRTSRSRA
ncbi:VanZ family protein [Vibrio parahaemolyticus]|nr:VanZ family protein [Vibrio parahaemolyticus]